jgi:nucleoside-diphosphate-sugar epimerase
MKILVTGGFGFLGTYLVKALVREGHDVRVLDVKKDFPFSLRPYRESVEVLPGEIRDLDTCLKACDGIDAVFHMAAIASIHESYRDPKETFEINVMGTENLLKASRDRAVKLFVFASSGKVYGNTMKLPSQETDRPDPTTPYGVSKYECENLCECYSRKFSQNIISLRYFSIYGPRMYLSHGLIGDFLSKALDGGMVIFNGTEDMERDFTYIDDAVAASLLCLKHPGSGYEVFNVGSGKACRVADLIHLTQKYFNKRLNVQYRNQLEGAILKTQADISRAQKMLSYCPKTTLEEGLFKTFDWFSG